MSYSRMYSIIYILNSNKDIINIQEPQIVEIKDTAAYASRIEEWLVPDLSLSPQREEIITVAALLSAHNKAPNLNILSKFYLEDNDIIYEHSLEKIFKSIS